MRREIEKALGHFLPKESIMGHNSDEHWNCFKGNVGETSDRRVGAHLGFFDHTETSLN